MGLLQKNIDHKKLLGDEKYSAADSIAEIESDKRFY